MHTHTYNPAAAHAHHIIYTRTPLHLYMHSPILARAHTHTHTHTLVPNYTYIREMPNITPPIETPCPQGEGRKLEADVVTSTWDPLTNNQSIELGPQ